MLYSDTNDPSSSVNSSNGASEVYIVYRNTVDFSKAIGGSYKFGPIKDIGATIGFDTNTKKDAFYNSMKQMLVFGPTFMIDVPGFLNIGILELWESNAPSGPGFSTPRYNYAPHPMLSLAWGIPLATGFSFEGYFDYITEKGLDESSYHNATAPETHFDGQIMADIGYFAGGPKGTFKAGIEYEWWKNKFGNDYTQNNPGAFAKTPMVRVEYHF
jgi:nucleoside-specific outer membrane channel protein Tsx